MSDRRRLCARRHGGARVLTLDTGPELTPPVEPTPAPPAHTGGDERAGTQSRPLSWAVLFSVLAHALLLSLTFSGDEFGLTGLDFAWRERRVDAADVRLVLAPRQRAASAPAATFGASVNEAAPPPSLAQPLPAASVLTVTLPDAPALESSAYSIGHVAIGCALCYLDFRFADRQWRRDHPQLALWHATFAARASVRATEPIDDA